MVAMVAFCDLGNSNMLQVVSPSVRCIADAQCKGNAELGA